jgi:hypothetical protein
VARGEEEMHVAGIFVVDRVAIVPQVSIPVQVHNAQANGESLRKGEDRQAFRVSAHRVHCKAVVLNWHRKPSTHISGIIS